MSYRQKASNTSLVHSPGEVPPLLPTLPLLLTAASCILGIFTLKVYNFLTALWL